MFLPLYLPAFHPHGHLSEGCGHTHLSLCFLPLLDSSLPALSSPWDMSLFFLSSAGGLSGYSVWEHHPTLLPLLTGHVPIP